MAEYYPLLAKAVGSLPNSTPETRRLVYERARKALIGQLRTLHPPVPDEDIERESVELDRAIARIEDELAQSAVPVAASDVAAPAVASGAVADAPPVPAPRPSLPLRPDGGALGPGTKPFPTLRTKTPVAKPGTLPKPAKPGLPAKPDLPAEPGLPAKSDVSAKPDLPTKPDLPADLPPPPAETVAKAETSGRPTAPDSRARLEVQRPIAPQPPGTKGPKRQMWIIWVGVGVVVALVAGAAWKLRDHPETMVRSKPAEQQAQGDTGKISERVGDQPTASGAPSPGPATEPETPAAPAPDAAIPPDQPPATTPPNNPEVPVAQRAALLVEAPDEPNKVKTFIGHVLWKLNNVSDGPSDAVGLGVEADVDVPDDNLKAIVTFEKNTDSSLPASHTIKVRFVVQADSASGDVKQISVPQLRKEDSPSGDPLAGVTVPVIQNSFLVGLSPGNAETANMELLRNLQWIDVPMLLTSGKIAKLTFEKGDSGQRDLGEAITAWQKP